MNAIPFNTLKLARGFEAVGMPPAMALALAMNDAEGATKADVALVKADVALVLTEWKGDIAAVHASVERRRRDMTIKPGGMIFLAAALSFLGKRVPQPEQRQIVAQHAEPSDHALTHGHGIGRRSAPHRVRNVQLDRRKA